MNEMGGLRDCVSEDVYSFHEAKLTLKNPNGPVLAVYRKQLIIDCVKEKASRQL